MTRSKKLLVLLASLGVIIAVFFIVSGVSSSYTASLTDETTSLFTMESADDAKALSWEYDGETISFTKNEDTWEYTDDAAFPVDQDSLNTLAGYLLSVTSSKTIESPDDVSQYGLDEPAMTITVESDDSSMTFEFGNATNITGEYYCSVGDGNVYLVSSTIADSFAVEALSLVEKEDIPDMGDTNSITVNADGSTYDFEYIEDAGLYYSDEYTWYYNKDGEYTVLDNELFSTYLSKITGVSFTSCVSYNASDEELAVYGLDDPAVSVNVNYTRTEEIETDEVDENGDVIYETNEYIEEFDLEIGNYDGDYCYARIPGSNMVYLISASIEDTYLYTSIDSLVPDDIIKLDFSELTGFDVTIDSENYSIEHENVSSENEEGETVTESVYTLDGSEIENVEIDGVEINMDDELDSLNSLTSTDKASNSAEGKEPVLSFVFYRDNENYPQVTLDFYQYDSSSYFVVLNGETTVLTDKSSVDDIADNILSLINGEGDETTDSDDAEP